MTQLYAAADIGSNTAHLLVAASDGEIVMRVDNVNEWIGLGEVVARRGEIPKDVADQLVLSVFEFKRVADAKRVRKLYVFATEAMRAAPNHEEVIRRIQKETGVRVEIISPEREAELSFLGVQLDTRHYGAELLFEVGGGSAQIAELNDGEMGEKCSLKIGTGKVLAESNLTNPGTELALKVAQQYIRTQLSKCSVGRKAETAVVSGGVGRGLWRALHPDGEKVIGQFELDYLFKSVKSLPTDRVSSRFSVKQKRAGTLLVGSLIYLELMRHFSVENLVISEFGVREGAVLEMAR
jgi:exopolyphosphatase/guanosine-5'-triphosphate,3'-diphosphate pyrophosphatase